MRTLIHSTCALTCVFVGQVLWAERGKLLAIIGFSAS